MKNVSRVYKNKLCCSCGVCVGVCPTNAIKYIIDKKGFFKPLVDKEKCINCGQCLKYCPGIQYYNEKSSNYFQYIYGYSNDDCLRKKSSSGAIGTELLSYLIERKYVDYCIVVKNIKKIGKVEVKITNNINEIRESSGSKYCPVPIGNIIKKIKDSNKKYAIIGLPCQISSIRKYFKSINNDNIKYYISLLCNHIPSYNASNFILYNLNIKKYNQFYYRGGGWPGFFKIHTDDKIYKLPYRKTVATGFGKYFKSFRCVICDDPFGKYADVSLGDSYFLTEEENMDGNTFCIVRNKELMSIIQEMQTMDKITIKEDLSEQQVRKAYKALYDRIYAIPKKISVAQLIKKYTPNNYTNEFRRSITLKSKLNIIKSFIILDIGRFKILWKYLFDKNNGSSLEINEIKTEEEE